MTSEGLTTRKEDNDGSCAICTELYLDPRLLPCRHTFCLGCLERWHASSHQRHYFSCPICREKVWLPFLGVQGFRSNYFVPSQGGKSCSLCRTPNGDVCRCNSCDKFLCHKCRATHGSNKTSKDCSPCCEQEDEIVAEEDTALRVTISALRPVTRSCCYAELIGGFQCSAGVSDMRINKIVPVSATEAWILFDNGPAVHKYNMSGMLTDVRCAEGKVIDICIHPDGPLLFIQEYSNSISVCGDENTTPIEYLNVGDYLPTSFLVRDEGSIIVAAKPLDESLLNVCYLIVFNQERNVIGMQTLRGEFARISSVALDVYSNRVCSADMDCRVVHVLPKKKVLTYRRSPAFPIRSGSNRPITTRFSPRAVCSGLQGAFLVLDGGSGYIHVLDTFACLTSVVVMDDQEHIGSPNTIAMGRNDRLWVGDGSDGMVKVYSVNAFINHLEPGTMEHGFTRSNTSGIHEHVLSDHSTHPQEHIPLPGINDNPKYISKDTLEALTGGVLKDYPPIKVFGGTNGIEIVLGDTGSPEGNIRERERVLRMLRENELLRKQVELVGSSADILGPANVTFKSASDIPAQQNHPNPHLFGVFSSVPNPAGNFPQQYGHGGRSFLTGNRDYDLRHLENFLKTNPAVREDMERKGITPGMVVDFPSFLDGKLF
ncbi:uncharacterized protein LOC117321792 [Pecten maximus]|uniref:uncharacterized protein LOC117321792 n=1 Tax=Pecten maximus TaxID=6579 RepID=UPI001458CC56|nr:uncharacterized protein LOC117321792 [Pecten maximus]